VGGGGRIRGSTVFYSTGSGLVLGDANGPSSLVTSMSMVAEWLRGWIDAAAANRVH
jgi:hypothetical protein